MTGWRWKKVALCAAAVAALAPAAAAQAAQLDEAVVREHQAAYPTVDRATLEERIAVAPARKRLLERWGRERSETFAGSRYDYETGVWHLSATDAGAAEQMAAQGRALGVQVRTRTVRYSLAELRAIGERVDAGRDPVLGAAGRGNVGVDVERNRVVVALRPAVRERLLADDRSRVALDPAISMRVDDAPEATELACTDRFNCGRPMRGGIVLWDGSPGARRCSLGYVARASDGSHWALTAGHCTANDQCRSDLNRTWGHGEQPIGPARVSCESGAVDAARIHIRSSYWLGASFGWIYQSPASVAEVDYAITARATIEVGDVICYSGWHASSRDNCGVVSVTADANHRGMVAVSRMDTCRGDSGGSVYWASSERWAYGLISAGSMYEGDDCTFGKTVWFSALPDINRWLDNTSAATVRVIAR